MHTHTRTHNEVPLASQPKAVIYGQRPVYVAAEIGISQVSKAHKLTEGPFTSTPKVRLRRHQMSVYASVKSGDSRAEGLFISSPKATIHGPKARKPSAVLPFTSR